jgi:ankyrin repeat protein
MVRFLASRGADVNARTRGGSTPMLLAATFKDKRMMDILKEFGASPVAIPGPAQKQVNAGQSTAKSSGSGNQY